MIINSYKHRQIINLIKSFQQDIKKLIRFITKLIYCKHFNMKLLLFRKFLMYDNIMLHNLSLSDNTYFCVSNVYKVDILFFYDYMDCGTLLYNSSILNINKSVHVNTIYKLFLSRICSLYTINNITWINNIFRSISLYLFFFFFYITISIFFYSTSFNFASLPNKRVKYTVLRSPHNNKKSREQFELKTYKKILRYPSFFYYYYNYLFINKHNSFFCNITHILNVYKYGKY